jgi:protein subunit release factor B
VNLTERFAVRPEKIVELKARLGRLGIDPAEIEESFIKSGGKGGQKRNKTANCVQLRFRGLVVRCARERERSVNRFLALRELLDKIEGKPSKDVEKIRKKKRRRRSRTLKKLAAREPEAPPSEPRP